MLEISSTDKGILIPRMDSIARKNIANPATGLMVYDTNNNSFWYYNGTVWTEVGNSSLAFVTENDVTKSFNNDNDFLFGADSLNYGWIGDEHKFFFDKSKAAFRVGFANDEEWDENNIGDYSFAAGYSSTASAAHSVAFGRYTEVTGDYGTAFSQGNSSGEYATAFSKATASGDYSTAFGEGSQALSYGEIALGLYNTTYTPISAISSDNSDRIFVIGNGNNTYNRSDALTIYKNGNTEINGDLTISGDLILTDTIGFVSKNGMTYSINNDDDFLFGADSLNKGSGTEYKFFFDKSKGAFRAGAVTNSYWDESNIGDYSFATGYNAKASGYYSIVLGEGTANGNFSTAFSQGTASGDFSIASGGSIASGDYSTAICSSSASGSFSTAFGSSYANGYYSTSFSRSYANGDYSTSFGLGSKATSYGEVTIGMYNIEDTTGNSSSFINTDRLFIIGNGTGNAARSDAMIVYKNGNTEINGDLTISGDLILDDTIAFISKNGMTYSVNNDDDFLFGADTTAYGGSGGSEESKFFFDKSKGAFRAGTVISSTWNEGNIGDYSFAGGYNAKASGAQSVAFNNGFASGSNSTAFSDADASGSYATAFSEGLASGQFSTAFSDATASGQLSTAFSEAVASGYYTNP